MAAQHALRRFEWNERIATGHPIIDLQHKELLHAFNDLADAIERGEAGKSSVKKMISFLKYYAEWHFGREENLCADCPLAPLNKEAHARFMQLLDESHKRYLETDGDLSVAHDLYTYLADWIEGHIMKLDKQLAQQIKAE